MDRYVWASALVLGTAEKLEGFRHLKNMWRSISRHIMSYGDLTFGDAYKKKISQMMTDSDMKKRNRAWAEFLKEANEDTPEWGNLSIQQLVDAYNSPQYGLQGNDYKDRMTAAWDSVSERHFVAKWVYENFGDVPGDVFTSNITRNAVYVGLLAYFIMQYVEFRRRMTSSQHEAINAELGFELFETKKGNKAKKSAKSIGRQISKAQQNKMIAGYRPSKKTSKAYTDDDYQDYREKFEQAGLDWDMWHQKAKRNDADLEDIYQYAMQWGNPDEDEYEDDNPIERNTPAEYDRHDIEEEKRFQREKLEQDEDRINERRAAKQKDLDERRAIHTGRYDEYKAGQEKERAKGARQRPFPEPSNRKGGESTTPEATMDVTQMKSTPEDGVVMTTIHFNEKEVAKMQKEVEDQKKRTDRAESQMNEATKKLDEARGSFESAVAEAVQELKKNGKVSAEKEKKVAVAKEKKVKTLNDVSCPKHQRKPKGEMPFAKQTEQRVKCADCKKKGYKPPTKWVKKEEPQAVIAEAVTHNPRVSAIVPITANMGSIGAPVVRKGDTRLCAAWVHENKIWCNHHAFTLNNMSKLVIDFGLRPDEKQEFVADLETSLYKGQGDFRCWNIPQWLKVALEDECGGIRAPKFVAFKAGNPCSLFSVVHQTMTTGLLLNDTEHDMSTVEGDSGSIVWQNVNHGSNQPPVMRAVGIHCAGGKQGKPNRWISIAALANLTNPN